MECLPTRRAEKHFFFFPPGSDIVQGDGSGGEDSEFSGLQTANSASPASSLEDGRLSLSGLQLAKCPEKYSRVAVLHDA